MKTLIWPWGIGLFIIFYMVTSPEGAASLVHDGVGVITSMANGLSDFVTETTNSV